MSGLELTMLAMLMGGDPSSNGFVERGVRVLVVSADATQVNQVRIERDFRNGVFFYAEEDTPRGSGAQSEAGRLTLLNQSDADPTVRVKFQILQNAHQLSISPQELLQNLRTVYPQLSEDLYMASEHGTPLQELRVENLQPADLKPQQVFLLPRHQTGTDEMPQWEYPYADRSVLLYIGSQKWIEQKLEAWSEGIAGNADRPSPESWQVGAKAFGDHYQVGTVRIDVTERRRLAGGDAQTIGEFALVSHNLQSDGVLVLPRVGVQDSEAIAHARLPLVHKTKGGGVQGFSAPAAEFITELIRPSLRNLSPEDEVVCHPFAANNAPEPVCVEDGEWEGGYRLTVKASGGDAPQAHTFYLRSESAGVERRWKVDITVSPKAPTVGDRQLFPIQVAKEP